MHLGPRLLLVKETYINIYDCLFQWKQKGLSLVLDLFCETNEEYKPVATYLMNHYKQMTGHFSRGKKNLQQPFEEGAFLGNRKLSNYMINALVCR